MSDVMKRLTHGRLWIGLSLALIAGMVAQTISAAQTRTAAESMVVKAIKTAKAQNKVVLVHFGASWCVWCKRLDAMLQGKELGRLVADHFVVIHMTVQESDDKKKLETPGAEEFLSSQGAGKSGVPVFMFFDRDGKKIADSLALPNRVNIGYPASPEEIEAFAGILEVTAPRMTRSERSSIVNYLKDHAPPSETGAEDH